ncbi:CBS domain-containing protein [bacterium]|nr:CBS domain-containing protein [bacterium]MBU4134083.1 CBS domain-containing protein [bacterium]
MLAKDVMSTEVEMLNENSTLADAVSKLLTNEISGMPVVDAQGRLIGVISEKDIFDMAFSGKLHETKAVEAMTREVVSFPPETDIRIIAKALSEKNYRRVPIINSSGLVVGIVSRRDILKVAF